MKNYLLLLLSFFLFNCDKHEEKNKFLGHWQMEEKLDPESYYVYNYVIQKNGEGFQVDILVDCHECGPTIKPSKNTLSGFYNAEKDVFEIQREGFNEILILDEATGQVNSNRKKKFPFKRIPSDRERQINNTVLGSPGARSAN